MWIGEISPLTQSRETESKTSPFRPGRWRMLSDSTAFSSFSCWQACCLYCSAAKAPKHKSHKQRCEISRFEAVCMSLRGTERMGIRECRCEWECFGISWCERQPPPHPSSSQVSPVCIRFSLWTFPHPASNVLGHVSREYWNAHIFQVDNLHLCFCALIPLEIFVQPNWKGKILRSKGQVINNASVSRHGFGCERDALLMLMWPKSFFNSSS